MTKKSLNNTKYSRILLQVGLAFVFAYAAIESFMHPFDWTSYLPNFLSHLAALTTLIKIFAVYEAILAVWLLSGKYLKVVGLLCALTFASILIFNPNQFIVIFRDVGLLLA